MSKAQTQGTADVKSALLYAREQLKDRTDNSLSEARLLLCLVLEKSPSWIMAWPESNLETSQHQAFLKVIARRKQGEPLAYITGERGFWSLTLKVSPDTLIPRADTEVLVETALKLIDEHKTSSLLDLGTGTGAIALALACEHPNIKVLATDFSHAALQVAKHNLQSTGLANVSIIQSNWFSEIPKQHFDLIVSNPPYIAENDEHLQDIGLKYEPITALTSGEDGLDDIRTIINTAREWLSANGHLVLEHGYNQSDAVQSLLADAGYSDIHSLKDYADQDRVTFARR